MKVKEESEKAGLKVNIQKAKIMASSPITSWQIDGETKEAVTDFVLLGSKITADGDCSHEIKRCLLLGRKATTNLDRILKSKDITLLTKVHIVKAMIFPVVMYGCKCWTIKKATWQRIDAFDLWCWRQFLSLLDSKEIEPANPKGNQSWIFIGRTDAEAEAPKLWPPDAKNWLRKRPWCWERLKAGGEGEDRGCDVWMASPTQWTWVWASSGSWWRTGKPGVLQFHGVTKSDTTEWLNWTELSHL